MNRVRAGVSTPSDHRQEIAVPSAQGVLFKWPWGPFHVAATSALPEHGPGGLATDGSGVAAAGGSGDDQAASLGRGLPPSTCCHTFRATGITAYLSNGGTLEHAQQIAGHASPKTTKLYDRTADTVTVDEIERIVI